MELSCTDCSDSESASDDLHPSGREPTADELALLARASSPSSWTVLANGRLGMELPQQKGIKQVYLAADGRTRLCPHGMTASAIATWMRRSEAHRKCPCTNLDGLTASRRSKTPPGWKAPPVSYFDVLGAQKAHEIVLQGGRLARQLPHGGEGPMLYMLASGHIRCAHGNSETTLRMRSKRKHAPRRSCECGIGKHSWRQCRLQNQPGKRLI